MASDYLDPIMSMIPGPVAGGLVEPFLPMPVTWGGLSVNNYLPVFPLSVGSPFPIPTVGRSFYGSVFYPYFSTPMSRWGDEWLGADVFDAGARLAYWGDATIATDPWIMPHYFDALMNRNNFPYGGFPFPWTPWIPAPTNLFGTPPGTTPSAGVSNARQAQPHSEEEANPSRRNAPERRTPDTHEPPPPGAAPPPPPSTPPPPSRPTGRSRSGRARRPTGAATPAQEGISLSSIQLVGGDKIKEKLGDGEFYTAGGRTIFVDRSGKVFSITREGQGTKAQQLPAVVRDNKLYPQE